MATSRSRRAPHAVKEAGPNGWFVAERLDAGDGSGLEAMAAEALENVWADRLREYKGRAAVAVEGLEAAFVPGAQNWAPLGPTVVLNGQAQGHPPVGGRIVGLALATDGRRMYAASANGGVFRSDDAGMTWRSLMDSFDVDPTNFASTSLACGAIAIHPANPDRIYVGTGEGDTHAMFENRKVHALPAYRGIGPIRSDDGGRTWIAERIADGSPELAGKAFFALAVDPADPERVIAATTEGLYERTAGGEWVLRRPGTHASVIAVAVNGATRFYAAQWRTGVVQSDDGTNWTALAGFPAANAGRIALAAQPRDPRFVYALVAAENSDLQGVHRFEVATSKWKTLSNPPELFPPGGGQGSYDLAITVDPTDEALLYLGGSYRNVAEFPASIWRCRVAANGAMAATSIGETVHADVHVLVHATADPDTLWTGCDGGAFVNRDPRGSGIFASRNQGLSCLCANFVAQHPADPNILFCGLQDNGTAVTHGGPEWTRIMGGDGGYCVVHWADPQQVLVYVNGRVRRSVNGGLGGWQEDHDFDFRLMTYPIVTTPISSRKADADLAAVAAVDTVHISTDFGITWPTTVKIDGAEIYSLVFASPQRLFAGTTSGNVYRIDKGTTRWNAVRIDDAARGPLGLRRPISDIAVDWSDPNLASIYVALGGTGDRRHVWRYDGVKWAARSGPAEGNNLLDVEHNAIAVDPLHKNHVYVGADIGVWRSTDGGKNWEPLPNALPDAPVFDLQIHPSRRLLRAATHGRGIYEWTLPEPSGPGRRRVVRR